MQTPTQTLIKALEASSKINTCTDILGEYTLLEPAVSSCTFVDGSNAVLVNTPSFCAQLIRIAGISFNAQPAQEWKRETQEFFSLAKLTTERMCDVENFGTRFCCGPFDLLGDDLRQGLHAASVAAVAGIVRRLAELSMAQQYLSRDNTANLLVLDGELSAQTVAEQPALAQIRAIADGQHTILSALSKTTAFVDVAGKSIPAQLLVQGPRQAWLFRAHNATTTGFVKLHSRSQHVFKLDVAAPEQLLIAANSLASQANDAQLPGYPYGLIAVDQLACIQRAESNQHTQHILGHAEKVLSPAIASQNAHNFF